MTYVSGLLSASAALPVLRSPLPPRRLSPVERQSLGKWALVEIDWLDSHHEGGWLDSEELELEDEEESMHHKTSGFVVFNEPTFLSVAQSISKKPTEWRNIDSKMTIPWCSILSIRELQ